MMTRLILATMPWSHDNMVDDVIRAMPAKTHTLYTYTSAEETMETRTENAHVSRLACAAYCILL